MTVIEVINKWTDSKGDTPESYQRLIELLENPNTWIKKIYSSSIRKKVIALLKTKLAESYTPFEPAPAPDTTPALEPIQLRESKVITSSTIFTPEQLQENIEEITAPIANPAPPQPEIWTSEGFDNSPGAIPTATAPGTDIQTSEIPPSSDAGQILAKFKAWGIVDDTKPFKIGTKGYYLIGGGVALFFINQYFINKRTPAKKRKRS